MNLKSKKLLKGAASVAISLSMVFAFANPALAALSTGQVDSIISLLQSFGADASTIANVRASLTGGTPVSTGGSSTVTGSLTKDLQVGMTDDQVKTLQMILNKSADTQVSTSGAGSPGMESNYFGEKTKAAVMKFQAKNGITPVAGYVGPKSRAVLNTMGGGTVGGGTTPTPSGTGLTVSAASQPSANLAPQGTSRVPFTKVTLTASNDGDVTVNGIVVERTGLAQDATFAGIVLLDQDGTQIGIAKTLNSNHQATVGDPFVIKAGTSKTITIGGNMASNLAAYAGQVAALSVVGVNSSATVNGSMPITGAGHTINATLTIGTAVSYVSSFDPNTSVSKEVGTTGYKYAGIRINAGSAEKVRLWSIRWNQSGSASSNDLGNVKVVVDGTKYDTKVSTDGKYYTASFGSGIVIDKGFSKDIYVEGDIVGSGAAGRNVKFDIYKTTDIYLTGETYGYGITPTAGSTGAASDATSEFTTGTPFFDGSKVTVTAGSATTIAKATSVAAQNIAVNVPNQILGGYETDMKGEPISVQQTVIYFGFPSTSTTATGVSLSDSTNLLTNVAIYDENGSVVAGPVDATANGAGQKVTFTDTITYPIGKKTYTIKGKVDPDFGNNTTIVASTTPSSDWTTITGQTTGNTITLSNSLFSMNTMTVKTATLAISIAATPAAATIVAGTQGREFANISLNATQSGEDVRFSTIPLKLTFGGGAVANRLTNCQLYDGSNSLTTGSNVVNPSSSVTTGSSLTYTLDQSLTVPKGTSKTLVLRCNVSSSASTGNTFSWGIASSPSITVTGVTSSNDVSETVTASNGQTMTIGSTGSIAVSGLNTTTYKIAAANTTGVEVARFNLRANNEAINLNKMGLTLTSGSSADFVGGYATIWDGNTQVGVVDFSGVTAGNVATSSNFSNVSIPKDSDKVLVVKADLGPIGSGLAGTPGRSLQINYNSAQGSGVDSGATVEGSGSTSFAGTRIQKSYPVVTVSAVQSVITDNYTGNLFRITVQANSTGDIVLNKLTFGVASSTLVADRFEMQGPNGIVSSTTPVIMVSSSTARVYFDSTTNVDDRVVSAGTSKDFYFRGINVNLTGGTDANKGSISLTLKGDTAYPTLPGTYLMSSTTPSGLTGQNTIWSPVSTSSVSTLRDITVGPNLDDWTNGYGMQASCGGSAMTLGQDCSPVSTGSN